MAFNMLPTGMSFQRLGQFPLDSSSLHATLAEAMDYVQNNPTAYPGQIIYIADARTDEEKVAGVEAFEAMHMITAEKEIKLVVSSNDLDMDDMVKKFEEAIAKLEEQLAEEHAALEAHEKAADAKHEEMMKEMNDMEERMNVVHEEMEAAAEEIHEMIQDKIEADHVAMKKEVEDKMAANQAAMDAKHAEMEEAAKARHDEMDKAMADMKAEMEAKHAEMEAEADAEHAAVRELVDIQKPFMADLAAYPTSKFLFACGNPMTVEPNVGQKYDAEKPEDAVAFVYRWAEGFEAIVVEKEEAAKVYLVGGHGHDKVKVKRPIPQTNILARNVKIKGLVGGSYFEGMVGHANIEAENCEFVAIMGAGWCGASVNGDATRMNVVDDINIKLTDCKVSSTLFGGAQGNGVADDVHIELNNCQIGWLTAGGSNGMTRNAEIVMNGGTVTVAQSTNRGIVHKAKLVLNDGVINNLYFGGETEDSSVNGLVEEAFVELNGGKVKAFKFGTNNGVEMVVEDIKGSIRECVVEQGDVSMFEQLLPFIPEHSIERDIKVNGVTVGGFEDGLVLERGTTLTDLLEMLLVKGNPVEYKLPELEMSIDIELEQEVGSIVAPKINFEFNKNDAGDIVDVSFGPTDAEVQDDMMIVDGENPEIFVKVQYAQGPQKQDNLGNNFGEPVPAGELKEGVKIVGFRNMFFGGDYKVIPADESIEVRALPMKEKVGAKEVMFVVPAGSQRVTVAVPQDVEVKEIQYMEQGFADYTDMFVEDVVQVSGATEGEQMMNYKVMTYIFAIPCSAKMTFKVVF